MHHVEGTHDGVAIQGHRAMPRMMLRGDTSALYIDFRQRTPLRSLPGTGRRGWCCCEKEIFSRHLAQ